MTIFEKEEQYLIKTYLKFNIELVKWKWLYVWDAEGKKYLDFYWWHAVCLIGHSPDCVIEAVKKQMEDMIFYSNIFYTGPQVELAKILCESLTPEKYKVYFANSWSEANETALKMIRKLSWKSWVISFENSFHWRSTSAIWATWIESYHSFEPNLDEYTSFAKFGDMESVASCYNDDTAWIIIEPIQSIWWINMAETSFYKDIENFCREKWIYLIFDEVQAWLWRTWDFWFCSSMGIYPDIVTTAKWIASGFPISAVILKEDLALKIKVWDYATTFWWGPVVCIAWVATLNEINKEWFLTSVKEKSSLIKSELEKFDKVDCVLWKGLLLWIKLKEQMPDLIKKCLDKGLIIWSSMDKKVIRLMPSLNVSADEVNLFLKIFKNCLE